MLESSARILKIARIHYTLSSPSSQPYSEQFKTLKMPRMLENHSFFFKVRVEIERSYHTTEL
jgi:hypothetical protein